MKNRKPNRLKGYNYSKNGKYSVTICTKNRSNYFGNITKNITINDEYICNLNHNGQITKQCWLNIPKHFPNAILDEFIIMPNHIHGIIVIDDDTPP